MLLDRLNDDMKIAMKARESLRIAVLRLTLSEVKNARIEKREDLTDDDVIVVLRRAVKKREEAVEQYRLGNRPELAEKEAAEAEILKAYLPRSLEGEALREAVDAAIREANAVSVKDMGKVMKAVMAAHAGRVDGKTVQEMVKARLAAAASD
jgi:uncharacterized protein YqeY